MTRITNLRPKNGAYFELDGDGHLTFKTPLGVIMGDTIEGVAVDGCFDYDVVLPEYKMGDLVQILDAEGVKKVQGYIFRDCSRGFAVAIPHLEDWFWFSKDSLREADDDDSWEIVGLWEEKQ